jgi:hypothetical protein
MNISDSEKSIISQLKEEILSKWSVYHKEFPNVLFHYTSADGLIGILSSKSIWMTDLRYMNDSSELQYSRSLIETRLKSRSNEIQREFIKRIVQTFDPFSNRFSVFATCFCEDGNLLSQWRGYRGEGGGYAIGIDFLHTIRFIERRCVLRKVIYDVSDQTRLVDETIGAFLNSLSTSTTGKGLEDVTSTLLPEYCQAFSLTVGEYLFCFKHPDFHQEREWRLVYFSSVDLLFDRGQSTDLPFFRSYKGNVIPYYTVSFENAIKASVDDVYGIPFPIVELVIGPTISSDLNQQSLKMIISSLNPDVVVNIKRSEIPLRWL